ncbi:hypothetical protein ACFRMQ_26715 [Kitasatospora sp. NPDC056783]|uniref:hypothetical protein n=1 Tax=Kitasatospora sp. NPDC056783 TaxID=3345943 RepID=UPI0036AC4502
MPEEVHVPWVAPVLGRRTRAFVESCPWPAPARAGAPAPRERMAALWDGGGREEPDVEEEWLAVPGGDGERVRVRILRPAGAREPLPVVLYLHGLGWMPTDAHAHRQLLVDLVLGAEERAPADRRRATRQHRARGTARALSPAGLVVVRGLQHVDVRQPRLLSGLDRGGTGGRRPADPRRVPRRYAAPPSAPERRPGRSR